MVIGAEVKAIVKRKRAALRMIAGQEAKELEKQAKVGAPWQDRTGATRGGIHGGTEPYRGGSKMYLAQGTKVGGYLEEGTGIYGPKGKPIKPTTKKALAFKGGNGMVIVKSVKGMQKQPIIEPTVERNFDRIVQRIGRALESE